MEKLLSFEELCPHVREVGYQRGDFWQIPRRIYDHQMLYSLSGTAHLTLEAERYTLHPGQLTIIPPDTPHTLFSDDPSTELIYLHVDFTPADDGDWVYQWYNTPEKYILCFSDRLPCPEHIRPKPVFPGNFRLPHVVTMENHDDVQRMFQTLVKAYTREHHHFTLRARITVMQIIDLILDSSGYWKHSEPIRVSDMIIQYIKANYMNRMTVQDICACTQYNPDYAGKLFHKETGSTVIDYLNRFRINKAQTLLLDESLTVAIISEMVGFQSVNYFSNVTKKMTGKSPRELRAHLLSLKNSTYEIQEGK